MTAVAEPLAPADVVPAQHTALGRRARFWLVAVALATGGFAIGTTEFVAMGLLPEIADGVGVSIPSAGHLISAYALGVVVGAPTLAALGARLPRRGLLLGLMGFYTVLNGLSALAVGFHSLLVLRFLDGLPHGAYFGVSALVASSLVAPERRGRAIATVMMGIPLANVAGVPLATVLGQHLGWRSAYVTVTVIGALALLMVALFAPRTPGDHTATGRRELAALRHPQLWFATIAGAIGFGGLFALMSYVAPLTTRVGGLGSGAVPVFLLVLGVGMVTGNWLAGHLVDRTVEGTLRLGAVGLAVVLCAYFVAAPAGWWALPLAFATTVIGSVLAMGFMVRLIDAAEHAQTLGAALSHASLNIGNALGAWLGGLVIAAGYGFRAPLLVGAALAVLGLGVIVLAHRAGRAHA